ncbi:thiamine phosphate synthase [Dyadobacter sp. CY312]|uniref:thiamine phosphate synthase n=1 Tax=Dyadobacter sp. CY312 TaxID=2907303 RepID=UPI001F3C8844|nr:thiamine phosphate synthase [Dyadobacter sp. CY312]MCE7039649.1 thiamine phosphate synthase [Dyadobacter sp. CY312]
MIDKLQFISNQTNGLSHLESIQIALDAGCRWIQLRIKDQPDEYVLEKANEAKLLCDEYQAKLIINDFPHVAKEVGAYGLHLGLSDMSISEARKIVAPDTIIGGTANTLENILDRIKEGADYVGLGPFQYTSTKQNLSPIVGLEGYQAIMYTLRQLGQSIPVIAIGGITLPDIAEITETGIHGVAISGSIIRSENPKSLVSLINQILC